MHGTIYKRGDIYHAQYSINGSQFRTSLRTKDEDEARRKFEALTMRKGISSTPEYYPADEGADWPLLIAEGEGAGGWLRRMLQRTKHRATSRKIRFSLALEDVVRIAERSAGRCELSGLRFRWTKHNNCLLPPHAPSLDRIVPADGYHPGNCRLVCYAMNVAISDWGVTPFEQLATQYLLTRGYQVEAHESNLRRQPRRPG